MSRDSVGLQGDLVLLPGFVRSLGLHSAKQIKNYTYK